MSPKISGLIFIISAVLFALSAMMTKNTLLYGIAIFCVLAGLFGIFGNGHKGKFQSSKRGKKGRFQA